MAARLAVPHDRPMTWGPPTTPQQPPPNPDRRGTARPVAAWLAATGGALVLTAAVIVVAGNWRDIAPGAKFGVLLVATAALGIAAERSRSVVPASARAVAHLAAALAAPVGIAALAVSGGTWPGCVIAGGLLASITCIVQARRWRAPLLEAAAVVAVGLALVGLAAVIPVPVGVLGAVAACVMLAARREIGATALGLAGAAAPFLTVLAEQRIGPGTLDRIGATGPALAWGAPVAGFLAGGVLAVVATRRAAAPLAAAALAAPVIGVVTGLSTRRVDAVVWACLPGLALIALEAVLAAARTEPWCTVARPIANFGATIGAALAVPLPGAIALAHATSGDVAPLPIVVSGAALSMSALRLGRSGGRDAGLVLAGVSSVVIGLAVALGWPWLATSATAAAAAVVLARGRRLPPVVTAAAWSIAFLGVARLDAGRWQLPETVLATLTAAVVATLAVELWLARGRAEDRPDLVLTAIVATGALLVGFCSELHHATAFTVALAGGVVYVAVRRPERAASLLVAVLWVGALAAVAPGRDGEPALGDDWFGLGIAAMAIAAATVWTRVRSLWVGHLAAVLAVAPVPYALAALGANAADPALGLVVVGIVLTGCSLVIVRSGPLASAGLAASVLAGIVAATDSQPLLVSVAATCGGLQCLLEGAIRGHTELTRVGAALTAAGGFGTWLTSGANAAVLGWLAPYGITGEDLAVAVTTLALFGAGALAGHRRALSSWVTAGPGAALAAAWLLGAQFTRDVAWSVPLALAGGVVAIAVGGWRRLAAPLILGTVTVAATVVASAGPRLAELGSWVWLTAGGIALIGLAVVVERAVSSDDGELVDWARLRETWR
jgi:hypothetical protein